MSNDLEVGGGGTGATAIEKEATDTLQWPWEGQ